jgi:hypothetical protein
VRWIVGDQGGTRSPLARKDTPVKAPNAQSRVYTTEKENMFADLVATSQGLGFKVEVLDQAARSTRGLSAILRCSRGSALCGAGDS